MTSTITPDEFIRQARPPVEGTCRRMVGRKYVGLDADDLIHDTYLSLLRDFGQFDPARGPVAGWAMVAARNRCIDAVKREARRRGVREGFFPDDTADRRAADPADVVAWRDSLSHFLARLPELLLLLSPSQRTAVVAHFGLPRSMDPEPVEFGSRQLAGWHKTRGVEALAELLGAGR